MFESVILGRSYSKKEYEKLQDTLRIQLFNTQKLVIENNIPVIIIVAGIDSAGRGAVINMLSEFMDAKGIKNKTFWFETDEERARPYAWRYWRALPAKSEIGVFFGGWYSQTIRTHCCGDITDDVFDRLMHRWVRFERTLVANGSVVIKLWLHIDKKIHKERMKDRLKGKSVRHFTPYDKKSSENYNELVSSASRAIRITDRPDAPWTLIDAEDAYYRNVTVAQKIISAIEQRIRIKLTEKIVQYKETPPETQITALDKIDLTIKLDKNTYNEEYNKLREQIAELAFEAYKLGISSTLVFEGWDAAGKGGVIRRISQCTDARITQVMRVAAPTDEELAHHYLWRFWRNIPMAGFITMYDRSWYGRVLVERVEKLTTKNMWEAAYAEINDFEEQLTHNNNILLKFWLHISEDEQLKRFKEREEVSWKQYKITPDDWRNREKRKEYLLATDEMFSRTSTDIAAWHIIPSEDKRYARIACMKIFKKALTDAIKSKQK